MKAKEIKVETHCLERYVYVAHLQRLEPDSMYAFTVTSSSDVPSSSEPPYYFRTLPASGSNVIFQIDFAHFKQFKRFPYLLFSYC